jgi:hypothetical protein
MKTITVLIAFLTLTLLGLMTACESAGYIEGGFDAGPISVEVRRKPGDPPQREMGVTGQLPPGHCLQVDFIDKDGNVVGTAGPTTTPVVGAIPPEATMFVATIVPCPEDKPEDAPAILNTPIYVWPLDPRPITASDKRAYHHVTLAATVTHPAGVSAFSMLQPLLKFGPQLPPDPAVQIEFFSVGAHAGTTLILRTFFQTAKNCGVTLNGAALATTASGTQNSWFWYDHKSTEMQLNPQTPNECDINWTDNTTGKPGAFSTWYAVR